MTHRSLTRATAALAVVAALAVAGCSSTDTENEAAAPASGEAAASGQETTEEESTASEDEAFTVPTVDPGTPELPVSFTDDGGTAVEVTSIDRVLVLDDATIEIAHALGVGDAITITPEDSLVEDLASLAESRIPTSSGSLTVEGVVALDPTLVIGSNMRRHEQLVNDLRQVGIPAVLIDTAQAAPDKIRKTAEVLGVAATGEELAAQVEEQIEQVQARTADIPDSERVRVMALSSSGAGDTGNTTAAGLSTPAHEIIVSAGAINPGEEAGLDRWQAITAEGLAAAKPDVVIVAASELEDLGGEEGIWSTVPGLSATPAAENKALVVLDDSMIKYSGVGAGIATDTLERAIYSD